MSSRYEAIAQRYAHSIREGVLRPGERLPSLRSLCRSEGVSLMTALAAYQRLEALQLVEALPRSGYRALAADLPELSGPAIKRPRVAAHTGERDALVGQVLGALEDPTLAPLGLGVPSVDLFPLAGLRRTSGAVLAANPGLWASYALPPGYPELRRRIAQRLRTRGHAVQGDEVLITSGAAEGLSLALQLLVRPGELVLVECPTFFGILNAARAAGARVIEVPGDPELGVDPARLDAICARHSVRAAVLMPSFANPTGSLMSDDRKRAWARALQRRRVALVEDDLYGDLAFDRRGPVPLSAYARGGAPSILVGSFSKTLLPGGRVGYLVAPTPWIERAIRLKQTTTLANVGLAERLATECLASGLFERHLRRFVPRLESNLRGMQDQVIRTFPPGTRVARPRGGYLLWCELPAGCSSLRLFHAAREAGVSICPGNIFSLAGGLDRFIRLNGAASGTVDGAVEQAIAKLGRLAHAQLGATAPA